MELKIYLEILARRWRIILLVAIVIICLAAVGSQYISPKYEAVTMLRIVTPLGGSSDSIFYETTQAARLVNTYSQIATSDQVNNQLKQQLGLQKLPKITVKVIPDSEIVQIIVEDESPALAAKTANLLADELLSYQDNAAIASNSKELTILAARKAELQTELEQAQKKHDQLVQVYSQTAANMVIVSGTIQLKQATYQSLQNQYEQTIVSEAVRPTILSGITKDALAKELDGVGKELDTLNQQYKDLSAQYNEYQQKISLSLQAIQSTQSAYTNILYQYDNVSLANARQENARNIEIVSPAVEPTLPTGFGRLFLLGLGILCGIIFGIVIAFVVENLDKRIFSLNQIERVTATPILGAISQSKYKLLDISLGDRDIVAKRDNWILSAKTLKLIQEKSIKTIMVTSPNPREGKSTIAYQLALGFAKNDFNVLVIDADLRMPTQHKLFNATVKQGLGEFLNGENNIKEMILKDVKPGINLLPSLTKSANPIDLLGSQHLVPLFESLKAYSIVLFDTPAFLAVPDTLDLAKTVDGVIMTIRWGHTTSEDIRSMCCLLESVGARLIGLVVNQVPSKKISKYYLPEKLHPLSERIRNLNVNRALK